MRSHIIKISFPEKKPILRTIEKENPNNPYFQKKIIDLEKKIEKIAYITKGANILLGGGIAIAKILSCYSKNMRALFLPPEIEEFKGFYREHYSIKILCPKEELELLTKLFEKRGYFLFSLLPNQNSPSNLEEALHLSSMEDLNLYQRFYEEKKQCARLVFLKASSLKEKENKKGERIYFFENEEIDNIIKVLIHTYETTEKEKIIRKEKYFFFSEINQRPIKYEEVEVVCKENKTRCHFTEFEGCFLNISPQTYLRLAHPIYMFLAKVQAYKKTKALDKRQELDISILERIIETIEPTKNIQQILSLNSI